jgi:hypothetical protein
MPERGYEAKGPTGHARLDGWGNPTHSAKRIAAAARTAAILTRRYG